MSELVVKEGTGKRQLREFNVLCTTHHPAPAQHHR
jgi:hypothetical protein